MKKLNRFYFYLGLIIFYLIIFFAPNKPIYFGAYFISTFFFYLSSKNIRVSLLFSFILSLFSNVGIAGSLFIMEPKELNLGSGWWISPMTLLILCLLPFCFRQKIRSIHAADIFILLFFIWNIVSFIIYPYMNVLYGIISLAEVIFLYFILRIFLSKENLPSITRIIISMLILQSILGFGQLILRRPLGLVAESVLISQPFGITVVEEENLFRITGTFGHPNFFASFLLVAIPFLFVYPSKNIILNAFKPLAIIMLFFTYSRAAWAIFILIGILSLIRKKINLKITRIVPLYYYLIPLGLVFIFLLLTPLLNTRLNTLPQAFEEGGSWNTRGKLFREGISLVLQYPATGVGLNQSLPAYYNNPVTDLFQKVPPSSFYKIHNTFLEIAAEIGIPSIIIFIIFLLLIIKNYLEKEKTYPKKAAFFGLLGLIGISMLNPFFHSSQFRLFFLLSAIILA